MSLTNIFIKAIGVILALAGLFLVLTAIGITVVVGIYILVGGRMIF